MIIILARFIGDVSLITDLVLCFLPLEFEVCLGYLGRLNEFHIIDIDRFSNEVRLFETCLIIIVDKAIDRSELRIIESEMSP